MVNACPMCLEGEETFAHLLLNCKISLSLKRYVIAWFRCNWILPQNIQTHFETWRVPLGSPRGWDYGTPLLSPFYGLFGRRGTLDALLEKALIYKPWPRNWSLSSRMAMPQFHGFLVDQIMLRRREVAFSITDSWFLSLLFGCHALWVLGLPFSVSIQVLYSVLVSFWGLKVC